ncbi:MAG: hypothetical protein CMN76_06810 [Spirochaetaceae bacterium]|nr:hypothetical protein [Spirochaetaceae bacterium]
MVVYRNMLPLSIHRMNPKARSLYRIGIGTAIILLLAPSLSVGAAPAPFYEDPLPRKKTIQTIGFGSCLRQNRPAPILNTANGMNPDLFVFLGDNVYADTTSPDEMKAAYLKLGSLDSFQALSRTAEIHAIWDDHDYGANDAGADFEFRQGAEKIFKWFWQMENRKPYAKREGVYASFLYRTSGRFPIKVQLILLDTRSFRSALKKKSWWSFLFSSGNRGPYVPDSDPEKTLLGKEQWDWLEHQFTVQADLRIVASSIQVLSGANGFETWANFPLEQKKLLELAVRSSGGTIFLSGDRHFAEISALDYGGRRLYDVTSSSLNQPLFFEDEHNPLRQGSRFADSNFGLLRIDDSGKNWSVRMQILDEKGQIRIEEIYRP